MRQLPRRPAGPARRRRPATLARALAVAALLALPAACIGAPAKVTPGRTIPLSASRQLLPAELAAYSDRPLDEAIRILRPGFTHDFRGQAVTVYVDGRPFDWFALRSLRASAATQVRLLSAAEAGLEYGGLHARPILDVRTRR